MVGVALDVGVAALGVHAAPWPSHAAKQELEHRPGADQLSAGRVVGEAHRVDDGHDLVGLAHLADEVGHLVELVNRNPGDARHDIRRVARVVGLHELEDRPLVLEGHVAIGETIGSCLIAPAAYVIRALGGAVSGEESVCETETLLDDERGVRVVGHIVGLEEVVLQDVVDQAAEVRDVGAGTNAQVHVGDGRGTREAWIRVDDLRSPVELGPHEPLKADRVRLGGVGPVDENEVSVLDVAPVVRHRSPSECGGQTDHRGAVSNPGLLF